MCARSLDVAFLWHMHQPSYARPGGGGGPLALPWVRLHAAFGYTDMVAALERHPEVRVTLNWVPVLIEQLRHYAAGGSDVWRDVSGKARDDFTLEDMAFLVPRLQHRPPDRRHTKADRERRARLERGLAEERFDDDLRADLADEVTRFHLCWSGARLRARPELRAWREEAGGFADSVRDALFALHDAEVAGLLPRLRALADRAQVELSCTPYDHPILPLVGGLDSRDFPHADDGGGAFEFRRADDAQDHVRRAAAGHAETFGAPPAGMWPAEGAVSAEAAGWWAAAGLRWIASDEEVLFRSRGDHDRASLAQPFVFETDAGQLRILFRDRDLSDRIGFGYSDRGAKAAVDDLFARLEEIRDESPREDPVLLLALDGENPWERFAGAGAPFLDELYERLTTTDWLRPVTMSEAVAREAPTLPTLATGSWIHGSLDTWAGHPEKLGAWRILAELRALAGDRPLSELEPAVARSLSTLEGSDWFWWLGDDHPSPLREEFDALFCEHVRFVRRACGRDPSEGLSLELRGRCGPAPARLPREWIAPRGDSGDALHWSSAGELRPLAPGGSMTAGAWPRVVRYGFERTDEEVVLHLAQWPPGTAVRVRVGERECELVGSTSTPEGAADHMRVSVDGEVVELYWEDERGRWPAASGLRLDVSPSPRSGDPGPV